nr:CIC_HP1_G0027410.mRNA.1.CDS.1 [Saccharomyces cerevisiae]
MKEKFFPHLLLKIPHDIVYTPLLSLAEILPIQLTLKQLKRRYRQDPRGPHLTVIIYPRLSVVEIWSFRVFLGLLAVLCLQTPPWKQQDGKFCVILSPKAKSLHSIDLTMVPSIKTLYKSLLNLLGSQKFWRMQCNLENRPTNWD